MPIAALRLGDDLTFIFMGGYETEFSMVYYGFYGPFRGSIETQLLNRLAALVSRTRTGS